MKFQPLGSALCGPTALRNAAQLLGVRTTVRQCTRLCRSTDDGTTEFGVQEAARSLELDVVELNTDDMHEARAFIVKHPVVMLCVDDWGHWVVVHRVAGDRFLLVDSENCKANRAENGCRGISWRTLVSRWRASARVQTGRHDRTYYGLAVLK